MAKWWEQDWSSLGPVPTEPSRVSPGFQAVMDSWGAAEPKARKGNDNGAIGTRIAAYQADPNGVDAGEVALLQQDVTDFAEAATLFLDEDYNGIKWSGGTEQPGFVSGFLKATPLTTLASELGSVFGPEATAACKDATAMWAGGGYQRSMVYDYLKDALRTIKVSYSVEDDLAKATANGFTVPSKIIGIDMTFDKAAIAARSQQQMQAKLQKTDDRVEYRRAGPVLVIKPDDANDPAWVAIGRDTDAQNGRIKVGQAHLYVKESDGDKGADVVRKLIEGLAGFTSGDGYKVDDGTKGVKSEDGTVEPTAPRKGLFGKKK